MSDSTVVIKLSEHPRAARHISLARGWGGLLVFAATVWLSWRAGAPPFDTGMRALVAGVLGSLAAWWGAVVVWRHLAVAELNAAIRRAEARLAEREAAAAAAEAA